MDNTDFKFNITPNPENGELTLRLGQAPKMLEPKPPVKINISGTLGCVYEWLQKRVGKEQFLQEDCHILVDRENVKITLITNENDEYKRGQIEGKLEYNPKFLEFGINSVKVWTPVELGMFFKMNRAFFDNRAENMQLVSTLMNFTVDINNKIDRALKENGSRTDNFTQIVNSNLPESFFLTIPIFKGTVPERVEIETFAQVNGREISLVLISPGAMSTLEDMRNAVINEQLELIRQIAPDIAIMEI